MDTTELLKRYENHPLGTVVERLENTQDFTQMHRFYIASKTMILLLEYQKELSKPEADALEDRIQTRVDLVLEAAKAKHSKPVRH